MRWNSSQSIADRQPDDEQRAEALALGESRVAVMERAAAMSLEDRLSLFEALSRDAAWARTAARVR